MILLSLMSMFGWYQPGCVLSLCDLCSWRAPQTVYHTTALHLSHKHCLITRIHTHSHIHRHWDERLRTNSPNPVWVVRASAVIQECHQAAAGHHCYMFVCVSVWVCLCLCRYVCGHIQEHGQNTALIRGLSLFVSFGLLLYWMSKFNLPWAPDGSRDLEENFNLTRLTKHTEKCSHKHKHIGTHTQIDYGQVLYTHSAKYRCQHEVDATETEIQSGETGKRPFLNRRFTDFLNFRLNNPEWDKKKGPLKE